MSVAERAPARLPDGSVTDPSSCIICRLDDAPGDAVVLRRMGWACEVLPGYEVPGWYVLRLRRHALGWTALTDDEAHAFGPTVRDLMAALEVAFDAPARYLMAFGEAYPHLHCVVTVRTDDVPPESRSGSILGLRSSRVDREAALALVPAVRAALPEPSGTTT